jgi:hypothetical protein
MKQIIRQAAWGVLPLPILALGEMPAQRDYEQVRAVSDFLARIGWQSADHAESVSR